jgi:hypothetical protein
MNLISKLHFNLEKFFHKIVDQICNSARGNREVFGAKILVHGHPILGGI